MRTAAIWTSVATVLPISSCLMLALFVRSRRWGAAGLAAAIVAGMLTVGGLGVAGVRLSRGFHLAIDLAALNAYLLAAPLLYRREPRSSE